MQLVEDNLREGIAQGWYRPELALKPTTLVWLLQIGLILTNSCIESTMISEVIDLYLNGIVTATGKAYIFKYLI